MSGHEELDSFIDKLTKPARSDNLYNTHSLSGRDLVNRIKNMSNNEGLARLAEFIEFDSDYEKFLDDTAIELFEQNNTGELTVSEMISMKDENPVNMEKLMNTLYLMNRELTENGYVRTTLYDSLLSMNPVGEEGAISNTYIVHYMDRLKMIMKCMTDKMNHQMHEYIVGLEINKILKDIPNFPRTYGFSIETNPVFQDNQYFGYALGKPEYLKDRQVYIQYFDNSIDLRFMDSNYKAKAVDSSGNTVDVQGYSLFQMIFLQLTSALMYAYTEIDFVHRDLNVGNVLLVDLGEIKAIPVMVPIYDGSRIRYEKRWIWSNLLVSIIDFGLSSVQNKKFKDKFGTRIISPLSIYLLYEESGIEEELVSIIPYIFRKLRLTNIKEFNDIMFNLLTGKDSPDDIDEVTIYRSIIAGYSTLRYYRTHPDNKYYTEMTVSKYCRLYSQKWTHSSPGRYKSLITEDSIDTRDITVRDTRQYYLLNITGNLDKYRIDLSSVIRNFQYRRKYTIPLYRLSTVPTKSERAHLRWSNDQDLVIKQYIRFYKWLISNGLDLNMSPYNYEKPVDFLLQAYRLKYPDRSSVSRRSLRRYVNLGYIP